jgi:hypothetical protein
MRAFKYLPLLALISIPCSSFAQADDTVSRAKEMFKQGAERFERGDYSGAIHDFESADQLIPRPAFSFNLAKAYDKLKEPGKAIFYYHQYLERDPHAQDQKVVINETARLRAEMKRSGSALLVIMSQPSGAAVTTNGAFVGTTPLPLTVSDGEHVIHLELGGIAKDVKTNVKPGDVSDLRILMNAPRAEPVAAAPAPPPPAPETKSEIKSNDDWSTPASTSSAPSNSSTASAQPASPPPQTEYRTDVPTAPPPPPPLAVVGPSPSSDSGNIRVVPAQGADASTTQTARTGGSKALTIMKYTGLGLTVASAGAWTYFGVSNISAANALSNSQSTMTLQQRADTANWGNTAGSVANYGCMPATIALAVATAVLFIIDR